MHELSLLAEVVTLVEMEARQHRASSVAAIHLQVGEMSGVDIGALQFAFSAAVAGTVAAQAQLTVEPVPVVAFCRECQSAFTPADYVYACPHCGQLTAEIRQGTEMTLASVELLTDD